MTTLEMSLLDSLRENNMLREGHFAFHSGRHSACLIDRDLLLADPATASRFGYDIAKQFFISHIDTIATPSIWGAGLAQWVGYFLEPRAKVVDATPLNGELTIADKLVPFIQGRRVLLVDNLIFSGATMSKFIDILRSIGATPVGIAALWSAGSMIVDGLPIYTVLGDHYPAYVPDDCPICAQGTLALEPVPY